MKTYFYDFYIFTSKEDFEGNNLHDILRLVDVW